MQSAGMSNVGSLSTRTRLGQRRVLGPAEDISQRNPGHSPPPRQGHSSGVSGASPGCLDVPRGGTGEPAGTTRCRLCQRAHIGSTSAQIRPLPSASAVVRATKRRRTRARPAAGPAQARTSPACTAARAPRAPRAPGRSPPPRRSRCDGHRTGTTARRWRTPGATARPTGPGRHAASRSASPRPAVIRRPRRR